MPPSTSHYYKNHSFEPTAEELDYDFIAPSFVDIHCHGGNGNYFSENAPIALAAHRVAGTGTQIATLMSTPLATLHSQVQTLKSEVGIAGIHLEGPYLAHQYCGAHSPEYLRIPDLAEIRELIAVGEGHIAMMTIAPELPNAIEAIEFLVNNGVVAAIGHSNANAKVTKEAIAAGATVVTHINNAMAKIGSSDSLLEVALDSNLYLELILDGHHVADEDARHIASQAPERIIVITDAMSAAGAPDGSYFIGDLPVDVVDSVAALS